MNMTADELLNLKERRYALMRMLRHSSAFTLIELLIVVAIIGILAAIAIPNFLQAQVRAKVARAVGDMRNLAPPMELYFADQGAYPPDTSWWWSTQGYQPEVVMYPLTTPVDFITSIPINPFPNNTFNINFPGRPPQYRYFAEFFKQYIIDNPPAGPTPPTSRVWAIISSGPDHWASLGEYMIFSEEYMNRIPPFFSTPGCLYDPTNGTVSYGDIVRVGP